MVSTAEPVYMLEPFAFPLLQAAPFLVIEQLLTLVAFHVIVELLPRATRFGTAEMERLGRSTVTVAIAGADVPPAPVQVTEYVEVTAGVTFRFPEVPSDVPLSANWQEVAPVELHVSLDVCPGLMLVGEAESVAVGRTAQEFEF